MRRSRRSSDYRDRRNAHGDLVTDLQPCALQATFDGLRGQAHDEPSFFLTQTLPADEAEQFPIDLGELLECTLDTGVDARARVGPTTEIIRDPFDESKSRLHGSEMTCHDLACYAVEPRQVFGRQWHGVETPPSDDEHLSDKVVSAILVRIHSAPDVRRHGPKIPVPESAELIVIGSDRLRIATHRSFPNRTLTPYLWCVEALIPHKSLTGILALRSVKTLGDPTQQIGNLALAARSSQSPARIGDLTTTICLWGCRQGPDERRSVYFLR